MVASVIGFIIQYLFNLLFSYDIESIQFTIPSIYHFVTSQCELRCINLKPFRYNPAFLIEKCYVDKIRIDYPWRKLRFRTLDIHIDRVLVLINDDSEPIQEKSDSNFSPTPQTNSIWYQILLRIKYWTTWTFLCILNLIDLQIHFTNVHVVYGYKEEYISSTIKSIYLDYDTGNSPMINQSVESSDHLSKRIKFREVSLYPIRKNEIFRYIDDIRGSNEIDLRDLVTRQGQTTDTNGFRSSSQETKPCIIAEEEELAHGAVIDKSLLEQMIREQELPNESKKSEKKDLVREFIHFLDSSFTKRSYILYPSSLDLRLSLFRYAAGTGLIHLLAQLYIERIILSVEHFPIRSIIQRWIHIFGSSINNLSDESGISQRKRRQKQVEMLRQNKKEEIEWLETSGEDGINSFDANKNDTLGVSVLDIV